MPNGYLVARILAGCDISGIGAFCCTDAARWLNGQRLEATGGVVL